MSGILRLENLNKGTTLKQGDKTVLSYRLSDADGEQLNIAGKTAVARLMHPDFTRIGYESESLTVSTDNTVQFSIDSIIPSRLYYLEITVDGQYIFPSRSDEGKLSIDRSSMGAEITIIENAGIDVVVRKAVDLINEDPSLIIDEDKLIGDIISNTGIGSINEYYEAFNDLEPKALTAISKSNEALNVANGIDAKATNALDISKSADTLSKSVQEQLNQVIIDGDSSVEAAQARVTADGVTKSSLKERLDDEHNEVTTQLTQNAKKLRNDTTNLSTGVRESSPTVAFIADDASVQDYTRLKPIFDSKGVRFGIGVVTSFRSSAYMTWEQIHEMRNQGYEIMAHSHTHEDLALMSKPQLKEEIETMMAIMEENGFYPESFVYPFNSYSLDSIDVMQKYFKYSFARTRVNASVSGNNFPIIDNQRIARVGLGSYFDTWRSGYPTDTSSLEYYKARVDEAVANNSLIAFVMHPWAPEHTETQQQHISDLIDYIKSLDVPIMLPTEAMKKHGNTIQIGSQYTSNKFWVDNEGEIDSTSLKVVFDEQNSRSVSTPISSYPIGRISYTPISIGHAQSQGFPRRLGGVLVTTIFTRSATYYALQEYTVTEDGSFDKFVRKDVGGGWGEFEPESKNLLAGGDNYLAFTNDPTTVPRLFTANNHTMTRLTHTISADGVVTFTITGDNAYYRPSNTPFSVGDDIPAGDYILNGRVKTDGATLTTSLWAYEQDGTYRPHQSKSFEPSEDFIDFTFRFNIDGSYPTYILSLNPSGDIGSALSLRDLALRRGNVEVAYSPRLQS